jgi:PKHD-type hydroxylase
MIGDPLYWSWKKELPESLCQIIIDEGLKIPADTAIVGDGEGVVDEKIRKSKVSWINRNSWIAGIVKNYVYLANQQAWNFNIIGPQDLQFTVYEPGGHYGFHEDCRLLENDMRKLSAVITITDENSYEGGDFEFEGGTRPDIKERGSILVFPSFTKHRVTPITSGTRYSLVSWFYGPKFN